MNKIVNVAVPVPIRKVFSYLIDSDEEVHSLMGKRVLVEFGKKILTGVVVSSVEEARIDELKYVLEILDTKPSFSAEMLKFTKWISDYYFCSWGETLKAALPGAFSQRSSTSIRLINQLSDSEFEQLKSSAPKQAAVYNAILQHEGISSVSRLAKSLNSVSVLNQLHALAEQNIIEFNTEIAKEKKLRLLKTVAISEQFRIKSPEFDELSALLEKKNPKQAAVLKIVANEISKNGSPAFLDKINGKIESHSALKTLISKGILILGEIEQEFKVRDEMHDLSKSDESILSLTEEQNSVKNRIIEMFGVRKHKTFLLHGVTGSGKTLIYMHLMKEMLKQNKSILILVPEISLTPQLIDRFKKAFPEKITTLHSRISESERLLAWKSIENGEIKIVIGARSAVFAPLQNLGLIIIDEEHEPSYKQVSPAPRYNARDAAIMRAKLENAVVVLGSATPSLESMFNAKSGKYELLEINNRADGAVMPEIIAVNSLDARKFGQMNGSFTKKMLDEIQDRIQKKEGVIIFQNRRGFSLLLECPECGHIPTCKNCDVSLTYHKKIKTLRCHYCGFSQKYQMSCPCCGSSLWNEIGSGTQKIEEELEAYFTGIGLNPVISRMDLDTTSRMGAHRKLLKSFSDGEIDILVGTQMVAKGLNFPHVTLVGVINADSQLYLPDFRATERTFQLLTQVAGRAGRSSEFPGKVIIQTGHPDNHAVYSSRIASYTNFYLEEISHRKKANYPPFTRFVMLEFSGKNETSVAESALNFFKSINRTNQAITVLGPVQPNIAKIKNEYRRFIIIKDLKEKDKIGRAHV